MRFDITRRQLMLQSPFGSPLASLTWCANHLNTRGIALKAGEFVIGGASTSPSLTRNYTTPRPLRIARQVSNLAQLPVSAINPSRGSDLLVVVVAACKSRNFKIGDTVAALYGELGSLETTILP